MKAQQAVVLVLKRLRRRDNCLKSHPTDWEKPGIEPSIHGLQDIGVSPTPRRLKQRHFKLIIQTKGQTISEYSHIFSELISGINCVCVS